MISRWLLPVVLAFALAGCASTTPVDPKDETLSVVFGYFDMKDAPSGLDWVALRQYGGKDEKDTYSLAAKDGLFFHVGVEPGSYQVDTFGSNGGFFSNPVRYNYGGKGRNATAIRITKPGVYFLGSHRYVNHPGKGFFSADKFEMQPASTPGEKELLQRLLKELETDGDLKDYARQRQMVKQRLGQR
jgi:hypothetical protein